LVITRTESRSLHFGRDDETEGSVDHLLLLEYGSGGFVVGDAFGELAQVVIAGGV
jgi:hypothetical protein